jgi:serine/threonine protein kinase
VSLPAREFLASDDQLWQPEETADAGPQDSCGLAVPPPDPYINHRSADGMLFAPTDAAGRPIVPGYEILDELGRGAMGVVFRARQVGLNRLVALKMILVPLRQVHAGRQLFQAEAEAVARLQHPHIVQIYEIGEYDGAPFFSLEFCPGGSLADRLAGKPLPAREGAELVQTLAGAIDAAHARGLIHRDLKPANVLLGAGGLLKITDLRAGQAARPDGRRSLEWRRHGHPQLHGAGAG